MLPMLKAIPFYFLNDHATKFFVNENIYAFCSHKPSRRLTTRQIIAIGVNDQNSKVKFPVIRQVGDADKHGGQYNITSILARGFE